jgi:hypothetical protein
MLMRSQLQGHSKRFRKLIKKGNEIRFVALYIFIFFLYVYPGSTGAFQSSVSPLLLDPLDSHDLVTQEIMIDVGEEKTVENMKVLLKLDR